MRAKACAIPHDWVLEVGRNLHRCREQGAAPYGAPMSPKKVAPKVKLVAVIAPLATPLRPTAVGAGAYAQQSQTSPRQAS
jgi:hypothetical protein